VKVVKNRPMKFLCLAEGRSKGGKYKKYEYVNLDSKKVERFPRIGAF
jgi:hypothetical protein